LFNQNAGSVVFPLKSGRRTKVAFMDTMLAALLLVFIGQAFGGERMSCEVQPVRGDGREWHYRTKVGGDPRICWYPGERMKPRSELYWDTETTRLSAPPSDAVEPKDPAVLERDVVEPKDPTILEGDTVESKDATVLESHPDGNFAERWRALDGR
jgi:hypothetical protein